MWIRMEEDVDSLTVWDLFDRLVPSSVASTSCPISSRDVLREQEEQSLVISSKRLALGAASPYALETPRGQTFRRSLKYRLSPNWYQCGYCSKIFSTRYYLDKHMDAHHDEHDTLALVPGTEQLPALICPAVHWCQFLSETACHDMALELEPYYDRGSEGYGDDRKTVARRVQEQTPPCTDAGLEEASIHCRDMFDACFGGDSSLPSDYLQKTLCAPSTCVDRLHHLVLQSSWFSSSLVQRVMSRAYDWEDEWTQYAEQGTNIILCCSLLFLLVIAALVWHAAGSVLGRRRYVTRTRSRLLGKPSRQSWRTERLVAQKKKNY
jgi:hypothetical protein